MIEDFFRTLGDTFSWIPTVHPRGRKLSAILFGVAAFFFLLYYFFDSFSTITGAICFISLVLGCFVAFFFRNPKRLTVFKEDEIACPADGRILSIRTEDDPELLVIRIFLSIFDVHIQRATIFGQVQNTIFTPGSFHFANNPGACQNQRNLIRITDGFKYAHVEQITGAIARRIECWVQPGEKVFAGQHIGMIYFGSQVAVYLPKDKVRITVKEGQKVQGALTVLGLWI